MNKKYYALFFVISLNFLPCSLNAEIFKYEDSEGKVHYVDSQSKIPEQYRSAASDQSDFPEISKVSGSNAEKSSSSKPDVSSSHTETLSRVELFVASYCGHCRKLEKTLSEENISFTSYDIEESETGKKEYAKLGKGAIPITRINGATIIRGNKPELIKSIIQNKNQ